MLMAVHFHMLDSTDVAPPRYLLLLLRLFRGVQLIEGLKRSVSNPRNFR